MKKSLRRTLAAAFLFLLSTPAFGATYHVPDDYGTIQAALDAAVATDTIIVRDGTWTGAGNKNLDFGGKAITLSSENGPESCVIDCEGDGRGFYFHSGETADSVVEGFAIVNGGNVDRGSGIYLHNSSSPSIINCTISNSSATSFGGGIACETSSSPTITGCTITGNWAGSAGGGILSGFLCAPTITDSTISNNSADVSGGGLLLSQSSATITGCTISGNSASIQAGGIECQFSSPTITDCIITNNSVATQVACGGSGGGIFGLNSSPVITGCTISGNSGSCGGGGLFFRNSSWPTITDCSISENTASYFAGGIQGFNSSLTVTGCSIRNNSGGVGGGIGCGDSSSFQITNSTVAGNSASYYGAGIYCTDFSTFEVANCTISDNSAVQLGGGVFCSYSSLLTLVNSILWGDTAAGSNEIYADAGSIVVASYSDIQGGWTGTGNINSNPLFVGGDYHLTAGSPCIDSGIDAGVYTDIDGDARPFDVPGAGKDGTGDEFDMGSDEYVQAQLTQIHLLAPADLSSLPAPPTFSWSADGGTNNAFAVDVALSLSGPVYSTFENLHEPIYETSWTMPVWIWNKMPFGKQVYWRVRGADLDVEPMTIITSDEMWSFTKQ